MALASTSVLVLERAPQNGCHQCLFPWGEPQLFSASPGGSPRSASGYDLGFFQNTVSTLGPRACEIVCAPFRMKSLFLTAPSSPESKLYWASNVLGAHLPCAGPPGCGPQCGTWTTYFLERTSTVIIILLFVGCPPMDMGLDYTMFLFLLPSYYGSFFIFYLFIYLFNTAGSY